MFDEVALAVSSVVPGMTEALAASMVVDEVLSVDGAPMLSR